MVLLISIIMSMVAAFRSCYQSSYFTFKCGANVEGLNLTLYS